MNHPSTLRLWELRIIEKRKNEFTKKKPDARQRKKWNRKISRACRNDYRGWVSRWTEKIEKAEKFVVKDIELKVSLLEVRTHINIFLTKKLIFGQTVNRI